VTFLRRVRSSVQSLLVSEPEREEAELERRLHSQPGVTRPNVIAIVSPKGGVGKTTSTFLLGNLFAARLNLRAVAVDANPDFGTLAALAPDELRSPRSLVDLLASAEEITSAADLRSYMSLLRSGLHLLGAPRDPGAVHELTAEGYGQLLALLGVFYEVVVLDLGTGVTDPLVQFAIERADQVVVVTTPDWATADAVLRVLPRLRHKRTTAVMNKPDPRGADERWAIEERFREQRLLRPIAIPFDERLRIMLDSGTYSMEALGRSTRIQVKRLGLAVSQQLV
jgi:MinD-like ATPase involved in chromosome partitioning or flagellar assembly